MTPIILTSIIFLSLAFYFGYKFQNSGKNKRTMNLEKSIDELEENMEKDIQNLEKDIQNFKL